MPMNKEAKVHIALAILSIVLIWSTSLSASKHLALFVINQSKSSVNSRIDATTISNQSHSVTNLASSRFAGALSEESERFLQCVDRQHIVCLNSLEQSAANALEVFTEALDRLKNSAAEVHLRLTNCSMEIELQCSTRLNNSESMKEQQHQTKESQMRQKLIQLQDASHRQQETRDAFWAVVECTRPHGNCVKRALSDQFSDAIQIYNDLRDFDFTEANRFVTKAKQRIDRAEAFIDSVRAISDHLAAVGIHLGVPDPLPPLSGLFLASAPNLPKVEEMFNQALEERLKDVQDKQRAAEDALNKLTESQTAELKQVMNSTSVKLEESTQNVVTAIENSSESLAGRISSPGVLSLANITSAMVLERLEVVEELVNEVESLGGLAIRLDYVYRSIRSAMILSRAIRTTRRDSRFAYDLTPLLISNAIPMTPSTSIAQIWSFLKTEVNPSSTIVAVLSAALFSMGMDRVYLPLWNDFRSDCSSLVSDSTSNSQQEPAASSVAFSSSTEHSWPSASYSSLPADSDSPPPSSTLHLRSNSIQSSSTQTTTTTSSSMNATPNTMRTSTSSQWLPISSSSNSSDDDSFSRSITMNVFQIAMKWASAKAESVQQHHALGVQASASRTCMSQSFTANEQVHQVDKQVRDHFQQIQSMGSCEDFNNNKTCLSNITWISPYSSSATVTESPRFDCSKLLDGCEVTCQGPSKELVFQESHLFTCIAQEEFHRLVRVTLIAIIVFVFINFARLLLLRGILRLYLASRSRISAGSNSGSTMRNQNTKAGDVKEEEGGYDAHQEEDIRPIVWHCNVTRSELCRLQPCMPEDSLRRFLQERDRTDKTLGWALILASAAMHLAWISIVRLLVV